MQTTNNTSDAFWSKISGISFIYSLMILFLHNTSNFQYFGEASYRSYPPIELAIFWIRNNLSYLALSSFFLISGLLMFRNFNTENCWIKIRKRTISLTIPFFIWNVISIIEEILVSNIPFFRANMVRHPPFEMSINNLLLGLISGKGTWFLLALILLALTSPLIHLIIQNKKTAILLIVALYLCNIISIPGFALFHGADNVCFYVMGAYIGRYYFDVTQKQVTPRNQWIGGTCFICLLFFLFIAKHFLSITWLTVPLTCLMSISFWFAYDCFQLPNFPLLTGASMFIYVSHFHIEPYFVKAVYLALPKEPQFCILTYLLSGTMTACLCLLIFTTMRKHFPKTLSFLTGGR